jgi:hypothetical protein
MGDNLLSPIEAGIHPASKYDFFNTPFSLRNLINNFVYDMDSSAGLNEKLIEYHVERSTST